MTKYIKQRLSVKIFIITFILLGAACSGTYFFISKLLPTTYSNLINAATEKAAMHLVEQMTAFDNIYDCENDISNFSKETNAAFWIEDSNGRIIYPDEASMETSNTSADYTVTFDEDESFIDMQPSGATTTNFYPFTLKNGTAYTLAVQTDLFVVQQATKVLLSILPYVILMVFLLSLLCAWLYTRYITRPIVRLSKISKQMAELDFSGQCSIGREDELGCLAQNLNSLSASLSTALNDLQAANQQLKTDIEKEQELERQRVDFFSAASHELKTPLTILKGHLAGMLNGVSGYENHIEYMERSLAVVDRMEKLVKELLYVSKAKDKYIYSAKFADAAVTRRRSESRQGVRLSDEKKEELDELVTRLVKKGQPLTHIYAEHENEMPVCLRTLYNYIDEGALSIKNIDLRRKTGYKPRKKKYNDINGFHSMEYRQCRTYEDFEYAMKFKYSEDEVTEMDTVKGVRESGKRLLTMIFRKNNVMLLFLMPDGKAESVKRVFDYLETGLGIDVFRRLFPVILTDNGSEFKKVDELELTLDEDGFLVYRTSLYYCDPMASWQKGCIEKNHEFIRYAVPKGKSLNPYTQEDMTLLMNHINSVKRPGLGNKSPYELVEEDDEDFKALMSLLKMHLIPPDEVHLMPDLFVKK